MRLGQVLPFAALPFVFALGWWSHPRTESLMSGVPQASLTEPHTSTIVSNVVTDKIQTRLSSARDTDPFDISDVKKRDSLESTIRGVPFSFLKQLYLERQDDEWKKSQEYYQQIPIGDYEAKKKQGDDFFKLFQRNLSGTSTYFASSEWTFRGGKRVPVTLVAQLYSSRSFDGTSPSGWGDSTQSDAALATKGEELCYFVSAYFRVGESEKGRYASEGMGSCLNSVSARDGKPFTLLGNYSKELTPFFDQVSVPLPGFGTDTDSDPQWYDSTKGSWSRLPRVRWESISKEEFGRIQTDLQADVIRN